MWWFLHELFVFLGLDDDEVSRKASVVSTRQLSLLPSAVIAQFNIIPPTPVTRRTNRLNGDRTNSIINGHLSDAGIQTDACVLLPMSRYGRIPSIDSEDNLNDFSKWFTAKYDSFGSIFQLFICTNFTWLSRFVRCTELYETTFVVILPCLK